jgi:DNA polymerase-3 subunit alpha
MVFPKTMQECGHKLADDVVVCVKGRLDKREDLPKLIVMDVEVFEPLSDDAPPLRIQVSPTGLTEPLIDRLKQLLTDHGGDSEVFLHLGERKVLRLPDRFRAAVTTGLLAELRVLFGPGAVL